MTLAVKVLDDLLQHDVGGKGGHSGAAQPTVAVGDGAVSAQRVAAGDEQHGDVLGGRLQCKSQGSKAGLEVSAICSKYHTVYGN